MPLTDKKLKAIKPTDKPYRVLDEKGLFIVIRPSGAKVWEFRYKRPDGRKDTLSLGQYPDVPLQVAREKRDDARKLLARGQDPKQHKRDQETAEEARRADTFGAIAREWLANKTPGWSPGHAEQQQGFVENDLIKHLGDRPIADIKTPELIAVLRKVQARGAISSGHRVKIIANSIFKYAVSIGKAAHNIAADISEAALIAHKVKHNPAILDPKELGELLVAIDGYRGSPTTCRILRLMPLVFVRKVNLESMEWREINWDAEQWEIPADKMKMDEPLIVPLCRQAIAILKDQQQHSDYTNEPWYVFQNARDKNRPYSRFGINNALRKLTIGTRSHGFRATARTLLDETLNFRADWAEQQLAHRVKDANGRAYNRTKHLDGRRKMMQKWADYLDDLKAQAKGENVVVADFKRGRPSR